MQEPCFWYVLYVRSNEEKWVIDDFKKVISSRATGYEFDVFCPESEYYYRNSATKSLGKVYRRRPMFPGYVFVETNMPEDEFRKEFFQYIASSDKIIRLLSYGESKILAIPREERVRLEYILRGKRCFDHSIGYIEGDKIVVTAGSLVGFEGMIKNINRHNRKASIEVDFLGRKNIIDVALEIVEKR